MSAAVAAAGEDVLQDLPPGFRFHPTDEEVITHYLTHKAVDSAFATEAVGEADFNKCEPWDLPKIGKKMGEKEWFFFYKKDRKYPTGFRTNRATKCGYWKATGRDKEIYKGNGLVVGMKKTLVFHTGRAPRGQKSNWVMHEFRLQGNTITLHKVEEWVVCKVFYKNHHQPANMNFPTNGVVHSPLPPPVADLGFSASEMPFFEEPITFPSPERFVTTGDLLPYFPSSNTRLGFNYMKKPDSFPPSERLPLKHGPSPPRSQSPALSFHKEDEPVVDPGISSVIGLVAGEAPSPEGVSEAAAELEWWWDY